MLDASALRAARQATRLDAIRGRFDPWLLALLTALICLGTVMVGSSSVAQDDSPTYYLTKHLLFVGAGLLGAVTLEEFAIALAVGLVVGAYSSLFVAAPAVVLIKEREPRNVQLRARLGAGPALSPQAMTARLPDREPDATGVPLAHHARSGATTTASGAGGSATPSYTGTIPPRPRKKGKKR